MEGEALALESGVLQERPALAMIEVAGVYRLAHTVGEDEADVPPPRRAQPLLALACSVCLESGHGGLVEGHAAAAGLVLWRPKIQTVLGDFQRAAHGELARV